MKHFFIFIFIWTKHAHFLLFWIFNGWIASSKKLNSEFKDQKIILGKIGDQRDQLLDLCSFTLFEITYKCKAMKEKQFSTSFFISISFIPFFSFSVSSPFCFFFFLGENIPWTSWAVWLNFTLDHTFCLLWLLCWELDGAHSLTSHLFSIVLIYFTLNEP